MTAVVTAVDVDSPLTVAAPCGFRTHFPSAAEHASVVCATIACQDRATWREARARARALSAVDKRWGWGPSELIKQMTNRLSSLGLTDIAEKLDAKTRLSMDDGVRLFACPDLHAVGWLANREREKRHGALTYYNFNLRLEATNVCVASCLFCSFARLRPGDPQAYTMSLDQVLEKLRVRGDQPLTEVHV